MIPDNTPLSVAAVDLGIARVALEGFGEDHSLAFPKTSAVMNEILEAINKLLPERNPGELVNERFVSPFEATQLRNLFIRLGSSMKDESMGNYILCVQPQRYLSPSVLMEKMDSGFSPESWKAMNEDAQDEFIEAGRCLALERHTAAGFHALRGVECTIRQYIQKLTGELPQKRDWGHYIEVLKKAGAPSATTSVLENIKTQDRNPLMHPEQWLDVDQAINLLTLSRSLLN
jgi:hypothetical protein